MARPSFVPPSDPTRDHLAAAHALSPGCSTRAYVDTLALLNQLWKDHVLQVSQFAHKISPSQPSPPPPTTQAPAVELRGHTAERLHAWQQSYIFNIFSSIFNILQSYISENTLQLFQCLIFLCSNQKSQQFECQPLARCWCLDSSSCCCPLMRTPPGDEKKRNCGG